MTNIDSAFTASRAVGPSAEMRDYDADLGPQKLSISVERAWLVQDVIEDLASMASQLMRRRSGLDEGERNAERRALYERALEKALEVDAPAQVAALAAAARDPHRDARALLMQGRRLFADLSELALAFMAMARAERDDALRAKVLEARWLLLEESDDRRDLLAGANAAFKARQYARKLGVTPRALRQLYRSFVCGDWNEAAMYRYLLDEFGERRSGALDFIESAVAFDIICGDPSCTQEEFGLLGNLLMRLRRLRSADRVFLAHLQPVKGAVSSVPEQSRQVQLLLKGIEDPMQIEFHAMSLIDAQLRHAPVALRGEFAQQILRAFAAVPEEMFVNQRARSDALERLTQLVTDITQRTADSGTIGYAG